MTLYVCRISRDQRPRPDSVPPTSCRSQQGRENLLGRSTPYMRTSKLGGGVTSSKRNFDRTAMSMMWLMLGINSRYKWKVWDSLGIQEHLWVSVQSLINEEKNLSTLNVCFGTQSVLGLIVKLRQLTRPREEFQCTRNLELENEEDQNSRRRPRWGLWTDYSKHI